MSNIISIDSKELININSNQDIIDKWLKFADVSNNTKQAYKKGVYTFIEFITNKNINTITREVVLDFKNKIMSKNSNATAYNYLSGLKSFYKFLDYENITQDITRNIKLPKIPKGHKKDSLTIEQLKSLLSSLSNDTLLNSRDYCIINLMIRTGLRSCEVLEANVGDIQTKDGKKVLYIKGKGHTEKDDFVVLEYDMLNIIDNYLNKRKNVIDKSPLFISLNHDTYGERLKPSSFRKIIKNRLRDAGIDSPRISAHSLRHTAVTFSLLGGASIQEAKDMARHTDVNTTLNYAHNLTRLNESPESKIEHFLRENITPNDFKN